jgi:hypothetical protein
MSSAHPPIGDAGAVNPAGVPMPDPAPGWPTPAPPPPAFSPGRGTSARRPGRFWYAIGVVLFVICVIVGITIFVVVLIQLMDRAPTDDHSFGNNESTTVHIDAGASKTIYVTNSTFSPSMSCTAANASGGLNPNLSPYSGSVTLANWRALFTVSAQEGGDYVISCKGSVSDARYGVGEHITVSEIAYPFLGAAAGAPFIIAGIAVFIVTFVRRSRSPVR